MATSDKKKITIAFEFHGTVIDPSAINAKLNNALDWHCKGKEPGNTQRVGALWSHYQREYISRLHSMQQYVPFSEVVVSSLYQAMSEVSSSLIRDRPNDRHFSDSVLIVYYRYIYPFADAASVLRLYEHRDEIEAHVFANDTPVTLAIALDEFQGGFPAYARPFQSIISVDDVKAFKPAPQAYHHLAKSLGKDCAEIWLVSSSSLDIMGAKQVGMKTCWVNRNQKGSMDVFLFASRDQDKGRPHLVVNSVDDGLEKIKEWEKMSKTGRQKEDAHSRDDDEGGKAHP